MDEDTTIPPTATTTRRKKQQHRRRNALQRIYTLLVSRLSAPLLTSLLLLPILPSNKHSNAIFELVPFYKSLKCLLSHTSSISRHDVRDIQQWLSYWTLYSFVRFLEGTRCNVSTSEERRRLLLNAIALLPNLIRERISKLFSSSSASPSTSNARPMTLATQIAGSSTRWTILKAILLFYAMDGELQGARRIMQGLIRPILGFFTNSLDEEDEESLPSLDDNHVRLPARRTALSRDEEEQEQNSGSNQSILKLNLASNKEEHENDDDDEPIHTPSTPELSMDGSYGGKSDDNNNDMKYASNNEKVMTVLIQRDHTKSSASNATTWPLETIAVEGNHWVH